MNATLPYTRIIGQRDRRSTQRLQRCKKKEEHNAKLYKNLHLERSHTGSSSQGRGGGRGSGWSKKATARSMYVVNLPRDEKYHTVRTRAAADLTAAHEAARADVFPESHQHEA